MSNHNHLYETIGMQKTEIDSLKSQLAEAQNDKKRLDWMSYYSARVFVHPVTEKFQVRWWNSHGQHLSEYFADFREALDAAMEAKKND